MCPDGGVMAGNPVDTRSGRKVQSVVDFASAGSSSLRFERYYSSATNYTLGNFGPTRLGRGWRSNFDSWLFDDGNYIRIVTAAGQVFIFYKLNNNVFRQSYLDWSSKSFTAGTQNVVATLVKNLTALRYEFRTSDDTLWSYDYNGRLRTIQLRGGYSQELTYDANGLNTLVQDSFGRQLIFAYTPQGLLSTMTASDGKVYQYQYLNHSDPTIFNGINVDTIDKAFFVLEKVIYPDDTVDPTDNPKVQYHYENTSFPFALTGITDQRGVRSATWAYDSSGRVTSSVHANGVEEYQFAYDDVANTTTVTNPLGKDTVYHFVVNAEALNRLTQIEGKVSAHCTAANTTYTYDTNRFINQVTDGEGRITRFVRDTRGNATSVTRAYGTASAQSDAATWHTTFNVPTQIVQPGLTTDLTWNTLGQMTALTETDTNTQTIPYSTNGQTRTWAYTYNSAGQLLTVDGPLAGTGDTVTYTYDTSGFLASVTNELGQTSTVNSVNGRGQPTAITDPNGGVTDLTYDSQNRLKTTTVDPSGLSAVITIDYNDVGDVTKIARPNGAYLQYTYDDARRITKVEDNTGAYVEYDRDNLGNATARRIKDSGGTLQLTQTATFDELGRLLTFVGSSSQTWTHGYDKTNNRVSVTDPRSNIFGWSFDALNRLISTINEEGDVVTLTRNGKDEITNYNDPRSLDTTYVRNGFGDIIQRTSPDTGTTVYTYNALGKPTQITDGRSVVTNLTYDNAGRLLTKQYPAATSENITYTWDSTTGGNKGVGRVTKIQDASGTIEWTYNALGQVTQEKKTTSSVAYTVGYAYDLDGDITQITYPSGRTVTYNRGSTGLVTDVTTKATPSSSSATLASSVAYQPFGPLQTLTYGNGLILWKTFTQDYALNTLIVEQGTNSVINRGYGYWNNDFDITNVWDNNVTSRTENYVYTPNHWLQNIYGDFGTQTYWQDGVGNRTYDIFDNGTTTTTKSLGYAYNNNLVLNTIDGSTTLRTITHDGGGNIITDVRGSTTYNYRYNNRGRLDRLTVGSTVKADYTYDGLERMAIRATQNMTPSGTTHYIYDRAGRLLAEATGTGTIQREYVWLDDMPLALFADLDTGSPKQWYVHPDHLDRPSKMTDASQAVVWDAWYTTYGEVQSITGSATMNLRFPGQYFLVESGLHYNWHRHYDPSLGRYIQPDPNADVIATTPVNLDGSTLIARGGITGGSQQHLNNTTSGDYNTQIGVELPEFVDGPSLYAYARSQPSMMVDWLGLQAMCWMPGSQCSEELRRYLQDNVNTFCKPRPPSCQPGDSCPSMDDRINRFNQCGTARKAINDRCYNGGDPGHQFEYARNRMDSARCLGLTPTCTTQ